MLELYQSPDFRTYRKRLVKCLVDYCGPRVKNAKEPKDFWETNGAIELARKVLAIPSDDLSNEDLKRHTKEDIETFFAELVRGNLEG